MTAEQLVDAEMIDQLLLCCHHVADGDDREIQRPGSPVAGLTSFGPLVPRQPPSTLEQMTK